MDERISVLRQIHTTVGRQWLWESECAILAILLKLAYDTITKARLTWFLLYLEH